MRLFKQLLTLVSVLIVSAAHADVPADSVSYYEMVRLAGNSLHQQVMLNESLKQQGREDEMKFVIEVSPSGGPYLMDEGIGTHAPLLKQAAEEKVKLEARLKAVYDQYHVEAYLLLLNYFDIKRKQQVLGTYTVDEVFANGVLDDTLNIAELKLYHESITNYIISERKIFDDDSARIVLSVGIYKAASFGYGTTVYFSKVKPNKKNEFVNTQVAALLHSYLSNTRVDPEEGDWAYPRFEVASLESAVSKGTVKAKILNTFAVDSMADLLSDYSRTADYAALTLKERLHIISVLLKEKLRGNYLVNENAEGAVIKIMNNTPAEQAEGMLKGLAGKSVLAENKDSGALIYRLYTEVDDRLLYMGGKNATALMTALKNLITASPEFPFKVLAVLSDPEKLERQTLAWQFADIGGRNTSVGFTQVDDVKVLSSGEVVITKKKVISKQPILNEKGEHSDLTGSYQLIWGEPYSVGTFQPFDLIAFTNFTDLGVLDEATEVKKGELLYVPAIFLMYAGHNKLVDEIATTTSIVIDVATIASGPGAFIKAVGVVRRGLVILDVANAAGSLVLTGTPVELQNPVFKGLVEYSGYTLLAVGGADLTKGAVKSVPAAMRAARSTTSRLSREVALGFVAAVMRVEVELTQLRSSSKAADEIFVLRDRIVKDWKTAKGEDLIVAARKTSARIITAMTRAMIKERLPVDYMDALKSFGKSEDDILDFYTSYHNESGYFDVVEKVIADTKNLGLSETDVFAIWGYTTYFFYKDLNKLLRDKASPEKTKMISDMIEAAMAKLAKKGKVYNGKIAYRAIELHGNDLEKFIKEHVAEGEVPYSDFLSAGGNKDASFMIRPDKNVKIIIDSKKSVDISDFADGVHFRGMDVPELLFARNSRFYVISVVREGEQVTIKMREL